jgi:pimeloyl-ACP methyl ester carboxylesterase
MKRRFLFSVVVLFTLSVAAGTAAFEYVYRQYENADLPGACFNSDRVPIHYAEAGRGTPVILVHGLTANLGLNWVRPGIFRELSKHYRVVAFDLRGHGYSGKPHNSTDYGTEMVEDILRLMDHLGIQKAHVVGYSMGGFIALKMAVLHPDRMLSVVPCGSGWTSNPDRDLAFLKTLADSIESGAGYGPLLERLQPVGRPVSPMRRRMVAAMMSLHNDGKAITDLLRSADALRVDEAALANNGVPALSIIGARDPLKPLADQLCAVMANIREVVVPGGDHFSTLSKPEFLVELEKFLAANSPTAAVGAAPRTARPPRMAKAA